MKKAIFLTLLSFQGIMINKSLANQLKTAQPNIEHHHEIASIYDNQWYDFWIALTPEERVFAYYMYRAEVPGNRIITDQTHRDALELVDLFQQMLEHKKAIITHCSKKINVTQFIEELELFSVYLFTHHGQYFLREFENHKRTPKNLRLRMLTKVNLSLALEAVGIKDARRVMDRLDSSLFDADFEPTVTVEGDIEKSAGNMYSRDFTEEDFKTINPAERVGINNYFYIEHVDGKRVPSVQKFKIGGKFSEELEVSHYWLTKAFEHCKKYPNVFDANFPASLEYMLKYLESGDEEDFKQFSIHWLKTNSKLDFNFGFVEVYKDPKQYRGSFEADITIKTVDMTKLNSLLPSLEQQLPFPNEFKRQNLDDVTSIPNASTNIKIFASGDAGPLRSTAAYCLPNYSEIRSEHGSKQIIYQTGKGLGELINPILSRNLGNIKVHAQWLRTYDPDSKLDHDIWDLHVLLHETLGHGSGQLAQHTFVEGDPLTVGGKTYKIGDTLKVTADNINEFLGRYFSGHEELRADIIALYTSIFHFEELVKIGLFKGWEKKLDKNVLIERMIIHMAEYGLKRLIGQQDDAAEIVQAHSQANNTITNFLIDHGGLELVEENYTVNGKKHTVIGIRVHDLEQAKHAVKDLAIEVQRIKSTADGVALDNMMKTYGTCIRHPHFIKTLKENRNTIQGDLKEIAEIYPRLSPIYNNGIIEDIDVEVPNSFLEQQIELNRLALSKE